MTTWNTPDGTGGDADAAAEFRRGQRCLETSEGRWRALFEFAPNGIALLGADLCIRDANPALCELLGERREQLVDRSFADLGDADSTLEPAAIERDRRAVVEQCWTTAAGSTLWVQCVATAVPAGPDAAPGVLVHVVDVTEERERQRREAHRSRHDELTGLANLRAFRAALDQALEDGRPGTLMAVGVDDLKQINKQQGNSAGDRVLQAVAGLLAEAVPHEAVVARVSGDEFAVLVDEAVDPEALGAALVTGSRALRSDDRPVTLSVGAAALRPLAPQAMLELADFALYEAKHAGSNRVVLLARAPQAVEPAHL